MLKVSLTASAAKHLADFLEREKQEKDCIREDEPDKFYFLKERKPSAPQERGGRWIAKATTLYGCLSRKLREIKRCACATL